MEKCLALWSNTVGKRKYASTYPDERRLDGVRRTGCLMSTHLNVIVGAARALKQDSQSRNRFPSIHESGLTPGPKVIFRQV